MRGFRRPGKQPTALSRLAIRSLGYEPVTELLPDPTQGRLLARVRLRRPGPASEAERQMLTALPHRHTHRGPFAAGPLPEGCSQGCSMTR
jgi:hypothetical protein